MDHFWNIPFFNSIEEAETGGWPIFWPTWVAGAQGGAGDGPAGEAEMDWCGVRACGSGP